MRNREVKMKPLAASILSLSLLTVMAGAAVAPALEVIRRHFSDASQLEVQLVVCMPALLIVITNMFFGRLASRFGARTLTMAGLALYTVGGAAAGLFNSIWAVLVMRAPCRAGAVPARLLPAGFRRRLGRNDRRLGSCRICQRRRSAVYHLVGFGKRGQGRCDYGHAADLRVAVSVAVFKPVHPLARVGAGLGSREASVLPRCRRERGVFAVCSLRAGQNNE